MFSPGQNVTFTDPRSGETFTGQIWGVEYKVNVVNIPALGRCMMADDDSLTLR